MEITLRTPRCADCGHEWVEHRFIWKPYISSFGPCAYPSDENFKAKPGKEPCKCKAYRSSTMPIRVIEEV